MRDRDRASEDEANGAGGAEVRARLLFGILLLTWLLLVAAPLIRGIPPLVGGITLTVLFAAAVLATAALAGRLQLSPTVEALGMLMCFGAWFVLADVAAEGDAVRLLTVPGADVIFLFGCVLGGRLLSRILRERNLMLPIALVLALADVFTVLMGPTRAMLERAPEVVTRLSVKLPQVGSAAGPEGVKGLAHIATMGPGDLVFAALFFACVVRFGLNLRASFWWIFAAVALGLAAIVVIPGAPPLPVLPLMALGFLIANRGSFSLTAREKRDLVIALAFLIVLFAGLGYLTRALVP
ncbi:MAG: hypothetical protein ACP5KN_06665 [Armatimonadota bacterium]